MSSSTPPNNGMLQPAPKPLISQIEQVTAPWIEGIQAIGQDKRPPLPKPPGQ